MSNKPKSPEDDYEGRFAWRKNRQIENLRELAEIAQAGGGDAFTAYPKLHGKLVSDEPTDALRWSIMMLWLEATECYIFGQFQACILTCGSTVERVLKLEYQKSGKSIPQNEYWTLGKCIGQCKGIVPEKVLKLARSILKPRNDRTHALLEHDNPQLAIIGGPNRGVEKVGNIGYLVEAYRGDAKQIIATTHKILHALYANP